MQHEDVRRVNSEIEQLIPSILTKLKSRNAMLQNEAYSMLRKLVLSYNSEQVALSPKLLTPQQTVGNYLIANLNEENQRVKHIILDNLNMLGYKPASATLEELLHDSDREIRFKAAFGLGKLGEKKLASDCFIELIKNLKASKYDREFGITIVQTLVSVADESTKIELQSLLEADNWAIRQCVIIGLGLLKDYNIFDKLIDLLQNKVIMIRLWAIVALSKLADRRAIPYLITMLEDKDTDVRLNAIYTLADFKAVEAIPALERARDTDLGGNDWETIEEAANTALGEIRSS